jgi:hypothetical protein
MKPRRSNVIALAVIALVSVAAAVAWAGDRTDPQPCRFDRQRFCRGVVRGEGRVMDCLLRHWDELTPACKRDLDSRRQKR